MLKPKSVLFQNYHINQLLPTLTHGTYLANYYFLMSTDLL